jgi:hypothetical protein
VSRNDASLARALHHEVAHIERSAQPAGWARVQWRDPAFLHRPQQKRILDRPGGAGAQWGMFLLRPSALRFARLASAPHGCATMFLAKTFELDTRNAGNPVVGWLDAALGLVSRFIPDDPPPIPIAKKYRKRDWLV